MPSHPRPHHSAARRGAGGDRGLSRVAAATLTSEAARHPGPKQVTVLGDDVRVVRTVLDRMAPADRVTLCAPTPERAEHLRERLRAGQDRGRRRVTVLAATPEEAGEPPADVLVVCDPVTGSDSEAREALLRYEKLLASQGVLSLAVPLLPGAGGSAAAEVEQVGAACGVRREVVLRSWTPLRVHHLRFAVADAGLAERLAPAWSPSRVVLGPGVAVDAEGVAAAAALAALALLAAATRRGRAWWLVPALTTVPVAVHFRDPHRETAPDPDAVVAASDGTVVLVDHLHDGRLGPGEWVRVGIARSLLSTRTARSPVAGRVVALLSTDTDTDTASDTDSEAEQPGPPGAGTRDAGTRDAERGTAHCTVLETTRGPAVVAQRLRSAGRRPVHRAPVGALLARGERLGLVHLGARTEVYLPAAQVEVAVAHGDRVVGAETVIARYRPRPRRRPSPRPSLPSRTP